LIEGRACSAGGAHRYRQIPGHGFHNDTIASFCDPNGGERRLGRRTADGLRISRRANEGFLPHFGSEAMERKNSLNFLADHARINTLSEVHANAGRCHGIPVQVCTLDARHAQQIIAQHSYGHVSLPSSAPGRIVASTQDRPRHRR
jgi:hypothetical protein